MKYIFTIGQIADILECNPLSVRRLIDAGKIKVVPKINRRIKITLNQPFFKERGITYDFINNVKSAGNHNISE
jgi:hypothetical protein